VIGTPERGAVVARAKALIDFARQSGYRRDELLELISTLRQTRRFTRYVSEGKAVSLLKAQLALSALAELRAGEREAAARLLMELVRRR
jgi:hypothetical protein